MREIEKLLALLRRVPLLAVDERAARARDDTDAIDYAAALRRWQSDAARMLAEDAEPVVERRDAFARIAVASEMLQSPATVPA